jgi:hypothetical protein
MTIEGATDADVFETFLACFLGAAQGSEAESVFSRRRWPRRDRAASSPIPTAGRRGRSSTHVARAAAAPQQVSTRTASPRRRPDDPRAAASIRAPIRARTAYSFAARATSPWTRWSDTPASCARTRACASARATTSTPVTFQPCRARYTDGAPVPQPRSSARPGGNAPGPSTSSRGWGANRSRSQGRTLTCEPVAGTRGTSVARTPRVAAGSTR